MDSRHTGFPLFALDMVALPGEGVPLHIFEERYRVMIEECLTSEHEFGIVWLSEDELKHTGCACEIEQVLERLPDGALNILARGTRAFRLVERQEGLPYPAGTVEFLSDEPEEVEPESAESAHRLYAELVELATDHTPEERELEAMDAYGMTAKVEFGTEAKQELLELRSENARLRLLSLLLDAALKRLSLVERAQVRARSNGKVRFE
jgi:Lon protease-like protein